MFHEQKQASLLSTSNGKETTTISICSTMSAGFDMIKEMAEPHISGACVSGAGYATGMCVVRAKDTTRLRPHRYPTHV